MVKQKFPSLSDEVKIYRAIIRRNGWIDPATKDIHHKAFLLRLDRLTPDGKPNPEKKLSAAISPKKARELFRGTTYGVIEIKVKDVRSLGLDVIQDTIDHLSITEIPCDEQSAKDFAIALAEKAKLFEWDLL